LATAKAIRLGYSPAAQQIFERLPAKTQDGLDRKLRAFGENPAIGKPLVGKLIGYYRVTIGRVRAIAATSAISSIEAVLKIEDGIVVVYVLFIGHRKAEAKDDPYERAALAVDRGDSDAIEAMRLLIEQIKASGDTLLDSD